jgi:hypothetical protein
LPLFLFFVILSRQVKYGHGWVLAIQLSSLLGLWALFLATIEGNFEDPSLYLPLPLLLLVALLCYRRQFMAASPASS